MSFSFLKVIWQLGELLLIFFLKHFRKNKKRKWVGKFWYLKYLSLGVHLRKTPSIIFSYFNFRCRYLNNQSEYRKEPELGKKWTFVDWCLVNKTAATLLMLQHPIPDKLNKRALGRFTPFRLLTLPKRKTHVNYIFIVNYSY